jgi:thioredoxin 1
MINSIPDVSKRIEVEGSQLDKTIFICFIAPWCRPCITQKALIDSNDKFVGQKEVLFVDTDEFPELAEKFNITAIPTIISVRNNEVVDLIKGVIEEDNLESFMNKNFS